MTGTVHLCTCGAGFRDANALSQHRRALRHIDIPHGRRDDPYLENWHAVAVALMAVGARAKAGEQLDIPSEAVAIGIRPARLLRSLKAQGALKEQTNAE